MIRKTKQILLLLMICTTAFADRIETTWIDSTRVRITFDVTDSTEKSYAIHATPLLTDGKGDTLRLNTVIFRGKNNRRYVRRGRLYGTIEQASTRESAVGDIVRYDTIIDRTTAAWLWQNRIELDVQRAKSGCCRTEPIESRHIGHLGYVPPFVPLVAKVTDNTGKAGELAHDNPVLQHISNYRPYDKTRILRKEKGALYVHFPLDQSVLQRDFRQNAETLDRIVEITRSIMNDSTSSVKVIQIVGLASVEGPQQRNNRLAGARAEALKTYVQRCVEVPDALFECVNGGEAWTELRDQIADGTFEGRDELLRIIDTEENPDRRETRIKQLHGGKAYSYLKDNVLNDQRNSGYLRIYYDYVPDTAAKTINRASELLGEARYNEALQLLLTVKTDRRAQNALGVAYYMTGKAEQAEACFKQAATDGNRQAIENLKQLNRQREAENQLKN